MNWAIMRRFHHVQRLRRLSQAIGSPSSHMLECVPFGVMQIEGRVICGVSIRFTSLSC